MKETIRLIVEGIPKGSIFDSHTVISLLIERYSDIYLANYSHTSTELYHGYIAQCIAELNSGIVRQLGQSWSRNIHGEYSKCAYWERI